MKAVYNSLQPGKIRLGFVHSLIFFALFFSFACREEKSNDELAITWEAGHATGIDIPRKWINTDADSVTQLLHVRLNGNQQGNMLGDYNITQQTVHFKPLIPLSRGQTYQIIFRKKEIATLTVPDEPNETVAVVAVYPSRDTLPENLLKFYVLFSSPMREGQALQHVFLLDEKSDTVPSVFLDLQPELWNEDRTALTLWLDPGRIKRDLIPNQKMGNPLKKDRWYALVVSKNFPDIKGNTPGKDYIRRFYVHLRDSIPPDPDLWVLQPPAAESLSPLEIRTPEALDYFLLKETISVKDEHGKTINGTIQVAKGEAAVYFYPAQPWVEGKYRFIVQPIIEDLAGNNLERPFDRDILLQKTKPKSVYQRSFNIAPANSSRSRN